MFIIYPNFRNFLFDRKTVNHSYLSFIHNLCLVFQGLFTSFFKFPLQLEAVSRKEHSIDIEGAQQAIQLVPTITD